LKAGDRNTAYSMLLLLNPKELMLLICFTVNMVLFVRRLKTFKKKFRASIQICTPRKEFQTSRAF
jgi:hypothetical protein